MRNTIITLLWMALTVPYIAFAANPDSSKKAENIKELSEYFEEKGFVFNSLLDDPRFKLIENISIKFTQAVEVKIENFEDYQRVIKYDRKRDHILRFMADYADALEAAEAEYGISKYVIAGIIGIESEFGKYKGSYNPFNVYVSMYAENHRSDFAKAQLEELLQFIKSHDLDVFELESSYAGAMSYAQFIPYSLNRWFVGKDLYDMPNNIKSVANYLAHYKEVTGTLEKAVFRYNPSTMYTKVVLALADEAVLMMDETE